MINCAKVLSSLIYPSVLVLQLIYSLKTTSLTDSGKSDLLRHSPFRTNSTESDLLFYKFCSDKFDANFTIFRYCYLPRNFQNLDVDKRSSAGKEDVPVKRTPDFLNSQNPTSLPCLCTIAGHCFGQEPYFPSFGLIELEHYNIPKKLDSKNKTLPLVKVLESAGFLELTANLIAPNSTCGDYVIWVIVRKPEFLLIQVEKCPLAKYRMMKLLIQKFGKKKCSHQFIKKHNTRNTFHNTLVFSYTVALS